MAENVHEPFYAHASEGADWQPLAEHLHNVAALACDFAGAFGKASLGGAAGLLHDLGKYSPAFQAYLRGERGSVDHSTAGARVAAEHYDALVGRVLAYAIAGHHAGLTDWAETPRHTPRRRALQERLADPASGLDPAWGSEITLPADVACTPMVPHPRQRERMGFQLAFLIRMVFSALVDADFRDTEAWFARVEGRTVERGGFPDLAELRARLDEHLDRFTDDTDLNAERNRIRRTMRDRADLAPGPFTLTVPTGGGKTLSSLAFALDHARHHGLRRVICVVPYTAIVEQTAGVFRNALGADAVLEHHSNFVDDGRQAPDARDKLNRAMETWDAPVVVTTAVQFFESLYANRPARCRKLHNIAGSVVILDEAQSLPLDRLRPCLAALDELTRNYRASVVLCTATQPAVRDRADDPGHGLPDGLPGLTADRELAPDPHALHEAFRRVRLAYLETPLDDAALAEACAGHEQVLCIVYTRDQARDVYRLIADRPGAFHLTTRMCPQHRAEVLDHIHARLKEGRPCRVIATALVEAGVDVDFPVVYRAEAGLDAIAQAAGRCNRGNTRHPSESPVYVFRPADWNAPREVRRFAQATRELMRVRAGDHLSPDAIDAYFRHVFWERESADKRALDRAGLLEAVKGPVRDLPFDFMAANFRMIDDDQRPVIIPYDTTAREAIEGLAHTDDVGGTARILQRYTVPLPPPTHQALVDQGVVQYAAEERLGQQFPVLVNSGRARGQAYPDAYDGAVGLDPARAGYLSPEASIL